MMCRLLNPYGDANLGAFRKRIYRDGAAYLFRGKGVSEDQPLRRRANLGATGASQRDVTGATTQGLDK